MSEKHIELRLVNRITIDSVGEPGKRVFLLQASDAINTITLKLEKEQALVLAQKSISLLEEIEEQFPEIKFKPEIHPLADDLVLKPPVTPLFAIGQMGLGYEKNQDLVILALQELIADETEKPSTVQFWITRPQLNAMSRHALTVAEQGRPTCPLCGQPIDPNGHFCPHRNGHDKLIQ